MRSRRTRNLTAITLACAAASLSLPATAAALKVTWMKGFAAPVTPAKYDKVGVIKVGPTKAKNVLVLAPGTSAGGAYFVPLAQWLVSKLPGWQVWSEERRENLLEDQSVLNLAKRGKASAQRVFDYYLGYITDPSDHQPLPIIPDSTVQFAKQWGMNVAVQDLHRVIAAAHKLGGNVVLGGHSLGGSVVTAYATWNFNGHPGADDLAGLVYIDGGSAPAESRRRRNRGVDDARAAGHPVAVVRRHRRAVRRAVQRDRLARRAAGPERAVAWAAVPARCRPI